MPLNHQKLVESYKTDFAATARNIEESFKKKELTYRDFSLGSLFEACFGWQEFRACRADNKLANQVFVEAAGTVSTAAFGNISGQIIYSAILEAYDNEELIISKLFRDVQTQFSGERIAGIQQIGDKALVVPEGEAYPLAGVGEDYIDTPQTVKRGLIVPITREAIFFDRTGVLMERCRQVGEMLAINKEKRACDVLIDGNAGAVSKDLGGHRYHWKGTSYATYQTTTPYINSKTSNGLQDWKTVEQAELLFANMLDPYTGEPITWAPTHLVVTPENKHTAKQILSATENRLAVGGYATSGNLNTRVSPNSLDPYQLVVSKQLKARLSAASQATSMWYLCNPSKLAWYMQNFPMEVREAPSNSHDEFHKDIVQQFRAGERGAYTTVDPRASVKNAA